MGKTSLFLEKDVLEDDDLFEILDSEETILSRKNKKVKASTFKDYSGPGTPGNIHDYVVLWDMDTNATASLSLSGTGIVITDILSVDLQIENTARTENRTFERPENVTTATDKGMQGYYDIDSTLMNFVRKTGGYYDDPAWNFARLRIRIRTV